MNLPAASLVDLLVEDSFASPAYQLCRLSFTGAAYKLRRSNSGEEIMVIAKNSGL
jgi:hypothetical protein